MSFRYFIVDDAIFIQEVFTGLLNGIGGHSVGTATSGDRAVFEIQRSLPDLVILDMVLPKLNGVEVAKRIKVIHPKAIIIATSTIDDFHFIEMAQSAGVNEYLIKPFTKKQVEDLVSKYFNVGLKGVVNG